MYEEEAELYKDHGVAYNTENFDYDFADDTDIECEGIFGECPLGNSRDCFRYKECREEYETL
jgi:hypothetical protein